MGAPVYDDGSIVGAEATWGEEPAERAAEVVAAWPDVFLRPDGSGLIWCDDRGRSGIRPVLQELDQRTLRGRFQSARTVFKVRVKTDEGWSARKVPPPVQLLDRIVTTRPGDTWRVLDGVAVAPYVLATGEMVVKPGWRDGLYLARGNLLDLSQVPSVVAEVAAERKVDATALLAGVRPRPEGYDADEAAFAVDLILSDLGGIEWASPGDRSAALAYFLTLISRPAYRLCPFFLFHAPLSGSGKDLVAKCMEYAAHGMEAMRITPPPGTPEEQATELEKRMTAALRAGESTIVLGDVKQIASGTIFAMTTEARAQGPRTLGVSEAVRPPRNLIMVGVGNNPSIASDMIRRSVSCRLMPSTGRPAERKFDLTEEQLTARYCDRRALYFCLGVNLLRGALRAAVPDLLPCSFASWSRMVQAACVHAGLPDPLLSRGALEMRVGQDDASQALAPLMLAWWAYRGDLRVTATQALAPLTNPQEDHAAREYVAALRGIDPRINARELGVMLASSDDATFEVISSAGEPIRVRLKRQKANGVHSYALERVR